MIIPVNEHYRIATDPNQWMVEKARTRNGKKDWESKFFYPTFESALKGLGQLMVRLSEAETLVDGRARRRKGLHHALPGSDHQD